MILSLEEAYFLLEKEKVPEHIIKHSEKVALISLFIGCFLKERGEKIDTQLLVVGALLHDIKKYESLLTGENHALLGYEFMKKLGYKRIGEIIKAHIYLEINSFNLPVTEEEIVHYADKRVMHDKIVTLKDRFEDLKKRYGKNEQTISRLEALEKLNYLIEKRIFSRIPFTPDKIIELEKIKEVRDVLYRCIKDCSSCWWNLI
ncbi:metal dependent phosphohydrolase [Thermodesulfobacterium geofontis OPF15]|jgi:putative nucleotidyltransferase with HDIG domain|uniref:Metal dependent phosphohydrolase n=1 Tax=Thermodesulfobacterium geofontis (strain OPF15) TaxID=795359 RepID=F8C5X4_THEGP|nr:HD domain-containing protein [Thermodesulfobacterium geofontis]AEH23115.1 metal dependent phosphohydrolase [Thermodesulfobacterium geofontis OPF15]